MILLKRLRLSNAGQWQIVAKTYGQSSKLAGVIVHFCKFDYLDLLETTRGLLKNQ
jgi:hypothetical protein